MSSPARTADLAIRSDQPRTSIPDTIVTMARRIVRAVNPLQVILFGSQARGDTNQWSDVDFLVVIPDTDTKGQNKNRERVWNKARAAVTGSDRPCDVLVATERQLRKYGDLVGMVFRPALRDGRIVYDASAAEQWDLPGHPVHMEVDPVTEEDRLAQTRLWLDQARMELVLAERADQMSDIPPGPACYHAQQAAEKAFKAVLVFLQAQYPFTHDLDTIRREIPNDWDVRNEFRNLKRLSNWSFMARYPGQWKPPTRADATRAIRVARSIYESVLRDLQAHGFVP